MKAVPKIKSLLFIFCKNFHHFFDRFVLVAFFERIGNAGLQMVFQDDRVSPPECGLDCLRLMQNIYTVLVIFDHLNDFFKLTFGNL